MVNHPNRGRAPTEGRDSFAELIARRPERLNILVTNRSSVPGIIGARGQIVSNPRTGNAVMLRYGYTPVVLDDGRLTGIGVPVLPDGLPDAAGIRSAVEALRGAWGPLHVQDNSGAVPDLHQGMFRG